jgi:protein TonB
VTGPSRRPATHIWVMAVCFAAALHAAGFAFALSRMKPEDIDDALGAPAIEIGLELTAPHEEQTDLRPGPAAEASAASSASVEQTAKVEQTDLPKDKPTETEDPDRLVAPDASKTPKDEKPTVKESKANPTAESVASEAAAPPSLETAREAPRSVAPAQGSGESAMRVRTTWQKELVAHLNRFKRYPATNSRRAVQITVTFTLDRLGHVVSSSLQQGSGDPAFDRAALAMMALADPVPPPPPLVADEGLTFSLPVIFRDKKK